MADYTALTVSQMEDLRRKTREQNGQAFVIKNTLFNVVLKEQGAGSVGGVAVGIDDGGVLSRGSAPGGETFP